MVGVKDAVINNINYSVTLFSWLVDGDQCRGNEREGRGCSAGHIFRARDRLYSNRLVCSI